MDEDTNSKQLMTTSEAAQFLGVSERTVRRWAKKGKIPALLTAGGHIRMKRADLEAATARLAANRSRQERRSGSTSNQLPHEPSTSDSKPLYQRPRRPEPARRARPSRRAMTHARPYTGRSDLRGAGQLEETKYGDELNKGQLELKKAKLAAERERLEEETRQRRQAAEEQKRKAAAEAEATKKYRLRLEQLKDYFVKKCPADATPRERQALLDELRAVVDRFDPRMPDQLLQQMMENGVELALEPYRERKRCEQQEAERRRHEEQQAREEARRQREILSRAQRLVREKITVDDGLRGLSIVEQDELIREAQSCVERLASRYPELIEDQTLLEDLAEKALERTTGDPHRQLYRQRAEAYIHEQFISDPRLRGLSYSDKTDLEAKLKAEVAKEVAAISDGELNGPAGELAQQITDEEGMDLVREKWIDKAVERLRWKFPFDRRFRSLPYSERQELLRDLERDLTEEMANLHDSEIGTDVSGIVQDVLDDAAEELAEEEGGEDFDD